MLDFAALLLASKQSKPNRKPQEPRANCLEPAGLPKQWFLKKLSPGLLQKLKFKMAQAGAG